MTRVNELLVYRVTRCEINKTNNNPVNRLNTFLILGPVCFRYRGAPKKNHSGRQNPYVLIENVLCVLLVDVIKILIIQDYLLITTFKRPSHNQQY